MVALKRILGIAGVPLDTPYKAQQWGKRFDHGIVFIIIMIVSLWYCERKNFNSYQIQIILTWAIWGYFASELFVCTLLVENKTRYLFTNWTSWIIILFGLPVFTFHSPYISTIRLFKIVLLLRLGKGDFIPQSAVGKFFSSVIIIIGVILVSMITASFAALKINKNRGEGKIDQLQKNLESIKDQLKIN